MAVDFIWKPYGVSFHTADVSPQRTIAGVTNFGAEDSPNVERQNVDGSPFPSITTLTNRDESISVTSLNPDDVLDVVGISGQCFRGNNTHGGCKLWVAKWDQCSLVPVAGAVHRNFGVGFPAVATEVRGNISLESLSCEHRGDAQAVFKLSPSVGTTGNTFAIEQAVNQSLPVFGDNQRRYTLGKTTVGGILVEGKTSLNVASNIQLNQIAADSNPATEFVSIQENKPIITIRGIDLDWAIPPAGLICTHANTIIYLRRRGQTAGLDFEPNNTNSHIKLTVKGRAFKTTLASGNANTPAEVGLTIYPEYDPATTTVPIVATTGEQIV